MKPWKLFAGMVRSYPSLWVGILQEQAMPAEKIYPLPRIFGWVRYIKGERLWSIKA